MSAFWSPILLDHFQELESVFDHPLKGANLKSLSESVIRASDGYIETEQRTTHWDRSSLAPYAYYFHLLNTARTQGVLRRLVPDPKIASVLDYGSGLGAATLALKTSSFGKSIQDFYAFEPNGLAAELAASFRFFQGVQRLGAGSKKKADLLLMSFSLNEIPDLTVDFFKPYPHTLVIEPGSKTWGRKLLELRKSLIESGEFEILAPCTHEQDCPLLVHSTKDWCHDVVALRREIERGAPPHWLDLLDSLPVENQALTASYLFFRKKSQLAKVQRRDTELPSFLRFRITGDPLREKGKTRQMICFGSERTFLSQLERKNWTRLELKRGDLGRLPKEALNFLPFELRLLPDMVGSEKKTSLYQEHLKLNAKMVPFAGFSMPVEYPAFGQRQEHLAVRSAVGMFDVSHMGEIRVRGPLATELLDFATTQVISKLKTGQAKYALLLNEQAGVVDDIIVYCLEQDEDYLVCVNASNTDKDYAHLENLNQKIGADLSDESSHWSQIAIQGPKALSLLAEKWGLDSLMGAKRFSVHRYSRSGFECLVAKTGYSGENGVEVFIPDSELAAELWTELLAFGVVPCGLGARDTLRMEAKYPLYGNDFDETTHPYSLGLQWAVQTKKPVFWGRDALMAKQDQALQTRWIGLALKDKGVPRHGYRVFAGDSLKSDCVGAVTSGTLSPSRNNEGFALALVSKDLATPGTELYVEIRSRFVKAVVISEPFISNSLNDN